jgi:hypothetical protein
MRGQSEPVPTSFPVIIELVEAGYSYRDLREMPDGLLWELLARRGWRAHWQSEAGRLEEEQARQRAASAAMLRQMGIQ